MHNLIGGWHVLTRRHRHVLIRWKMIIHIRRLLVITQGDRGLLQEIVRGCAELSHRRRISNDGCILRRRRGHVHLLRLAVPILRWRWNELLRLYVDILLRLNVDILLRLNVDILLRLNVRWLLRLNVGILLRLNVSWLLRLNVGILLWLLSVYILWRRDRFQTKRLLGA